MNIQSSHSVKLFKYLTSLNKAVTAHSFSGVISFIIQNAHLDEKIGTFQHFEDNSC